MFHCRAKRARVLAVALMELSGCFGGPGDRPELGTVQGTVTLNGKPLANAAVFFDPQSTGRTSTATTDAGGHYELEYTIDAKGAKIGMHNVRVSTYVAPLSDSKNPGGVAEQVPAQYRKDGALTREVKEGDNTIDLVLSSEKSKK